MVISIPEILTAEESGNYIMSIRLKPDGLSFFVYDSIDETHYFYRTVEWNHKMPFSLFMREVFLDNEWLSFSFKQVYIVFTDAPFLLVPQTFYDEKESKKMISAVYSCPVEVCLVNRIEEENSVLLFAVSKEIQELCLNTLVQQPIFVHRLSSLLIYWKKQSQTVSVPQMYLDLYGGKMNIVCFNQGKLLFANTFEVESDSEKLYFTLAVWKELNLNQITDQLNVMRNDYSSDRSSLIDSFKIYLQNVRILDLSSELTFKDVDPTRVSINLIALSL